MYIYVILDNSQPRDRIIEEIMGLSDQNAPISKVSFDVISEESIA